MVDNCMTCPDCGKRVRGDWLQCISCGAALVVNEQSLDLQRMDDLERMGCCPCCERPMSECNAAPCIEITENDNAPAHS